MSEYMVINPRGRKRRRRKTTTRRRRTTRRKRRNPGMYALNKRRRTYRRRRNPRALFGGGGRTFKLFGIDVGAGAWIVGGLVGTNWLSDMIAQNVPMEFVQTRPGRILVKAGVTTALAAVGGGMLGKKAAALVAVGGTAAIVLDVYGLVAENMNLPAIPGMGEYVPDTQYLGEGEGGPSYEFGAIPAPNRNMFQPNWSSSDDTGF